MRLGLVLRRAVAVALALAWLCWPAPAAAAAVEAPGSAGDGVRDRVERIVADPAYQTGMPEEEVAEEPMLPDLPRIPAWLAKLLVPLFWVVLIGAVVFLLVALVHAFLDRGSGALEQPSAAPATVPERRSAPRGPLPDAEALAREGRFGEAVHALLLHALALLGRRRGTALAPSLTSREVLGRSGLDGTPRQSLAELVAAVEHFLFAGRPLDGADWERCRDAYRSLDRATRGAP